MARALRPRSFPFATGRVEERDAVAKDRERAGDPSLRRGPPAAERIRSVRGGTLNRGVTALTPVSLLQRVEKAVVDQQIRHDESQCPVRSACGRRPIESPVAVHRVRRPARQWCHGSPPRGSRGERRRVATRAPIAQRCSLCRDAGEPVAGDERHGHARMAAADRRVGAIQDVTRPMPAVHRSVRPRTCVASSISATIRS